MVRLGPRLGLFFCFSRQSASSPGYSDKEMVSISTGTVDFISFAMLTPICWCSGRFRLLALIMSSDGQSLQYPDLNTKLIVTIFHSESQFLRRRESDSISVGHVSAVF